MQRSTTDHPKELVGRIVYQYQGFPRFYKIVKETPRTVMLTPIPSVKTGAQPSVILGQRGTEIPVPDDEVPPEWGDPKYLRRATKHEPKRSNDRLWFSHKGSAFFLWDGKPLQFDSM